MGRVLVPSVQEALLIRLNLTIGSKLRIGQATFLITAVLTKEPDKIATAFSLGPSSDDFKEGLAATQLVKTGSRIHERYRLKISESASLQGWLGSFVAVSAGRECASALFEMPNPDSDAFWINSIFTWVSSGLQFY